jgi:ComF family protein
MTLIHRFKYEGKIQLVKPLSNLLLSAFIRFWENNRFDAIVPVPLHAKRFRMRGFNQAYLLVKDWQRMAPIDVPVPSVVKDVLLRNRLTAPQTGLGRKERTANMKHAFSVAHKSSIIDKKVLLVDDVYTTGATVEACAEVMMRAGVRQVDVLTLARA